VVSGTLQSGSIQKSCCVRLMMSGVFIAATLFA
jgi:hypothetical protein